MSIPYIDGLVQDCSNSIANALELLQSCTALSLHYKGLVYYQKASADALAPVWPKSSSNTMMISLQVDSFYMYEFS